MPKRGVAEAEERSEKGENDAEEGKADREAADYPERAMTIPSGDRGAEERGKDRQNARAQDSQCASDD